MEDCNRHPNVRLEERIINVRQQISGCTCYNIVLDACLNLAREVINQQAPPAQGHAIWEECESEITNRIEDLIRTKYDSDHRNASVRGAVRTIAKNVRSEQYRRAVAQNFNDAGPRAVRGVVRPLDCDWLRKMGFDDVEIDVVRLIYGRGYSATAIAEKHQIRESSVYQTAADFREKVVCAPIDFAMESANAAPEFEMFTDEDRSLVKDFFVDFFFALRLECRATASSAKRAGRRVPITCQRLSRMAKSRYRKACPSAVKRVLSDFSNVLHKLDKSCSDTRVSIELREALQDVRNDLLDELRNDRDWIPFELGHARLSANAIETIRKAFCKSALAEPDERLLQDLLDDAASVYVGFWMGLRPATIRRHVEQRDHEAALPFGRLWCRISAYIWPEVEPNIWRQIAARLWFIENLEGFGLDYVANLSSPVHVWYRKTRRGRL